MICWKLWPIILIYLLLIFLFIIILFVAGSPHQDWATGSHQSDGCYRGERSCFLFITTLLLHFRNQFLPIVPTFAVRETDISRHKGGHPRFPHYAERRQSLGQQMLERWAKIGCKNATVGKNGIQKDFPSQGGSNRDSRRGKRWKELFSDKMTPK